MERLHCPIESKHGPELASRSVVLTVNGGTKAVVVSAMGWNGAASTDWRDHVQRNLESAARSLDIQGGHWSVKGGGSPCGSTIPCKGDRGRSAQSRPAFGADGGASRYGTTFGTLQSAEPVRRELSTLVSSAQATLAELRAESRAAKGVAGEPRISAEEVRRALERTEQNTSEIQDLRSRAGDVQRTMRKTARSVASKRSRKEVDKQITRRATRLQTETQDAIANAKETLQAYCDRVQRADRQAAVQREAHISTFAAIALARAEKAKKSLDSRALENREELRRHEQMIRDAREHLSSERSRIERRVKAMEDSFDKHKADVNSNLAEVQNSFQSRAEEAARSAHSHMENSIGQIRQRLTDVENTIENGKEREDRADRLLNTASENANWAVHVLRSQRDPLEVERQAQKQIDELKESVRDQKHAIDSEQNSVQSANAEISRLKGLAETMQSAVDDLQSRIAFLEFQSGEASGASSEVQDKANGAFNRVQALEEHVSSQDRRLNESISYVQREANQAFSTYERRMEEVISRLDGCAGRDELRGTAQSLQHERATRRSEENRLASQIHTLEAAVRRLQERTGDVDGPTVGLSPDRGFPNGEVGASPVRRMPPGAQRARWYDMEEETDASMPEGRAARLFHEAMSVDEEHVAEALDQGFSPWPPQAGQASRPSRRPPDEPVPGENETQGRSSQIRVWLQSADQDSRRRDGSSTINEMEETTTEDIGYSASRLTDSAASSVDAGSGVVEREAGQSHITASRRRNERPLPASSHDEEEDVEESSEEEEVEVEEEGFAQEEGPASYARSDTVPSSHGRSHQAGSRDHRGSVPYEGVEHSDVESDVEGTESEEEEGSPVSDVEAEEAAEELHRGNLGSTFPSAHNAELSPESEEENIVEASEDAPQPPEAETSGVQEEQIFGGQAEEHLGGTDTELEDLGSEIEHSEGQMDSGQPESQQQGEVEEAESGLRRQAGSGDHPQAFLGSPERAAFEESQMPEAAEEENDSEGGELDIGEVEVEELEPQRQEQQEEEAELGYQEGHHQSFSGVREPTDTGVAPRSEEESVAEEPNVEELALESQGEEENEARQRGAMDVEEGESEEAESDLPQEPPEEVVEGEGEERQQQSPRVNVTSAPWDTNESDDEVDDGAENPSPSGGARAGQERESENVRLEQLEEEVERHWQPEGVPDDEAEELDGGAGMPGIGGGRNVMQDSSEVGDGMAGPVEMDPHSGEGSGQTGVAPADVDFDSSDDVSSDHE